MNRRLFLHSLVAKIAPYFHGFLLTLSISLSVFSGSNALADIAFVKTVGTAASTTKGTSLSVTVPASGVAAGNSIIVSIAIDPSTGTVSCSDSKGNSYAIDRDITNGSGTTGVRTIVLSAHNVIALTSGNAITCSHASVGARAMSANEFSGIAQTTPKDQSTAASGNSTAASSGSTATTAQAVELLLGAIGVEGKSNENFTAGSGYTTIGRAGTNQGNAINNVTINPEYHLVSATSAYSATATLGTPHNWAAAIVTYKAAGTATKLVITSVNGGANPAAGAAFSVVVQAQNAGGTPANVLNVTGVSLSLKTGTGVLGGTLTGTIAAGTNQATISGVTYTKAESGVVLTATRATGDVLAAGDSAPFSVNPGNPTTLAFTTQPGNANAGSTIPGPPTVTVRDGFGNTVTSSTASITVAIGTNPGGGTLSGTATRNASAGVASFADLSINQAANGYTLTASSTGLNGATSSAFNVITLSPDLVVSSVSNPPASAVMGGSFSVTDTTANNGNGAAGASTTNYRLSPDNVITTADPLLTGTRSVPALAAGANSSGTVTVSIPTGLTPGTYFLGACADSASAIVESNETNNCLASTSTVTVSATPNIISLSVTSGSIGTSVTITGSNFGATQGTSTVTFNGTAATPTSWSETSIVTSVPSGATTGLVVVTVSGVASNGTTFTVTTATGTISGTVTRASDGIPINGALVEALQGTVLKGSGTTGGTGSYSIAGLAAGTYSVRASANGFAIQAQNGIAVTASTTTTANFSLNPVIEIISPAAGSTINDFSVLVTGLVNPPAGTEVGVNINGFPAHVDADAFAAVVPVDSQTTNLTATMTDMAGTMLGSHMIPLTVQASEPALVLQPIPAEGISPLTVSFTLTSFAPITQVSLDLNGDAIADFQGTTLEGQTFLFEEPGLYFPTVTVTDNTGVTRNAVAVIHVYDPASFDALLQSKWQGLKNALRTGDPAGALLFIAQANRNEFQQIFQNLTVPLSTIDQVMTNIQFVQFRGNTAEYEMLRTDERGELSYLVRFVIDQDGIWRIKDM